MATLLPRRLRITDYLLSRDPKRRIRVVQTSLAILITLPAAGVIAYAALAGFASWAASSLWTLVTLGGGVGFFWAIRSGWSERFKDPSLTIAQMVYAVTSCAGAYAIAGAMRGAVFPLVMVVLTFGMFSLTPRPALAISLYAVVLFGTVMLFKSHWDPGQFLPSVELGHFLMLGAMMPFVSLLAGQLSRMRSRLRQQKRDLEEAVERIQFLATRDDLTGLINRRQVSELMEREVQRSMRTGTHFCVALIDLDYFKRINDTHGHSAGDEVLRAFAMEGVRIVRASDVLGRWGGEEFLLLMPDAALPPASQGAERLRLSLEQLDVRANNAVLRVTLSAGVVQNQAGESVVRMVERADAALYRAKSQGRNRIVIG